MDLSEEEYEDDPQPSDAVRANRKDAFPIDEVLKYFLDLRGALVKDGKLVPRTDEVWTTLHANIMKHRTKPLKVSSLYAMVARNRHQLGKKLGLETTAVGASSSALHEEDQEKDTAADEEEPIEDDGDDINHYTKKFTMTLSTEEWTRMAPELASYQSTCTRTGKTITRHYKCLKRRVWTNIIDDHFQEHTRLGCKLTYTGGRVRDTVPFTKFKGKCEHCGAELAGEMEAEPEHGKRALFLCVYTGSYKMKHPLLKRQIKGSKRDDFVDMLVEKKMSSSLVRALKAEEIMNEGEREPPQVPNARSLRQAKYMYLSSLRLHDDPVMAIIMAKHDILYSAFLKDVTYEKFIVHIWNTAQIHAERNYVQRCPSSSISIDASGGFVHKLTRMDGKKSGHIMLYEAVMKDNKTSQQVSVGSMLTERQDTETIRHWLTRWLRDGALEPKECVIDMSMALTAGCIQAFAKMQSLQDYLSECSKILHPGGPGFVPPPCYVRYDVAHFIKLLSGLKCLNKDGVVKRTRQFYLRCLGQLIQCQDIQAAGNILRDVFTVALNESEGKDCSGEETPALLSKRRLLELIGKENQDSAAPEDDGLDVSAREELDNSFWENLSSLTDNFGKKTREFSSWGETIFENVAETAIVEGDWGNQQFLPDLPKSLLKLVDVIPLWSAIMVPFYGYGGPTASSAASESNFNDLKNRVFKHLKLPVRLDEFILFYIKVLSGKIKLNNASLLEEDPLPSDTPAKQESSTSNDRSDPKKNTSEETQKNSPKPQPLDSPPTKPESVNSNDVAGQKSGTSVKTPEKNPKEENLDQFCSLCNENNVPDNEFSCFFCGVGVHANPRCAVEVGVEDDKNLACIACSKLSDKQRLAAMEQLAKENWRGLADTGKRKRKSYLEKNSEWLSIDLNDKGTNVKIAIVKNGNDTSLMPVKIQKETFVLTNTCPFDSVLQLYASSYCDSAIFKRYVEGKEDWPMAPLIIQIATKGATPALYRQRAAMLKDHFPTTILSEVRNVHVACHVQKMLDIVNVGHPSAWENISCTSDVCPRQQVRKEMVCVDICLQSKTVENIGDIIVDRMSKVSASTCREKMTKKEMAQGQALVDKTWSKHPMCNGSRSATRGLQGNLLWLLLQDNNKRKLAQCTLRIGDLPKKLHLSGMDFHLRGVVAFKPPVSKSRGALGHYRAFCFRRETWEIYDDQTQKVGHCSPSEVVVTHAVLYTQ